MILFNKETGEMKETKEGFSWTMLFCGVFVPLSRGDYKWFLLTGLLAFFTMGISWVILPFFYNDIYTKELKSKGWLSEQQYKDYKLEQQADKLLKTKMLEAFSKSV